MMCSCEELDKQIRQTKQELEQVKSKKVLLETMALVDHLQKAHNDKNHAFCRKRDNVRNRTRLHEYAEAMQSAKGATEIECQYVIRLEAQLCRHIHQQQIWDNQMEIIKKELDRTSALFFQHLTRAQDDKAQCELNLYNQLVDKEEELAEWRRRQEKTLQIQHDVICRLQSKVGEDEKRRPLPSLLLSMRGGSMKTFQDALMRACHDAIMGKSIEDAGDDEHVSGGRIPLMMDKEHLRRQTNIAKVA